MWMFVPQDAELIHSHAPEMLNEMCCGAPMQSTALARNLNCLDEVENNGLLFEFCWQEVTNNFLSTMTSFWHMGTVRYALILL
jgi:hypothetical protein